MGEPRVFKFVDDDRNFACYLVRIGKDGTLLRRSLDTLVLTEIDAKVDALKAEDKDADWEPVPPEAMDGALLWCRI